MVNKLQEKSAHRRQVFAGTLFSVIQNLPLEPKLKLATKLQIVADKNLDNSKLNQSIARALVNYPDSQTCQLLDEVLTFKDLKTAVKKTSLSGCKGSICAHIASLATNTERLKEDAVARKYIINLQQQVYFLELELNRVKKELLHNCETQLQECKKK
jgi:hypothetical protein